MLRGTIIDAKDREKSWNIQETVETDRCLRRFDSRWAAALLWEWNAGNRSLCGARPPRTQTAIHVVISRERASITRRSVAPRQNISRNILWNTRGGERNPTIYFSLLRRFPTTTDVPFITCADPDISPITHRGNLINFKNSRGADRKEGKKTLAKWYCTRRNYYTQRLFWTDNSLLYTVNNGFPNNFTRDVIIIFNKCCINESFSTLVHV